MVKGTEETLGHTDIQRTLTRQRRLVGYGGESGVAGGHQRVVLRIPKKEQSTLE